MKKETVPVTVAEKEVFGYDEDLVNQLFGKVVSRIYEGESVQRHFYVPADEDKEYLLGPTTTSFNFVDHTQALTPLINRGFEIRKMSIMKSGLKMFAIMTPCDGEVLEDPIRWDVPVWGGDRQPLLETAVVTSSIGPGQGIHYSIGYFRLVCTNGLVSEILGTGVEKFSHLNWSGDHVNAFISSHRLSGESAFPIGTKKGIEHSRNLLADLKDESKNVKIPIPIQKTLGPLLSLPDWYQTDIDQQFSMILDNHPKDDVSTLDLLNVITSPINLQQARGEDRSRFLFRTERIAMPLCQLIAFMSLGG